MESIAGDVLVNIRIVGNKKGDKIMTHPDYCFSNDHMNNCTIIKWGESGYYITDYPKGKYTNEIIDEMNSDHGVTPQQREAMVCCSIAASNNPDLDWEDHYGMILEMEMERSKR